MGCADPAYDRYGSPRDYAAVHAADAAQRALGAVSWAAARIIPTLDAAVSRQSAPAGADNLNPGATISVSAIRAL